MKTLIDKSTLFPVLNFDNQQDIEIIFLDEAGTENTNIVEGQIMPALEWQNIYSTINEQPYRVGVIYDIKKNSHNYMYFGQLFTKDSTIIMQNLISADAADSISYDTNEGGDIGYLCRKPEKNYTYKSVKTADGKDITAEFTSGQLVIVEEYI